MEYNYVLTTEYDGNTIFTNRINDFDEACRTWEKCVDSGEAKNFATYVLTDPTGRSYIKMFSAKKG